MKTQILSKVMKDAWRFFRMTGQSFSECLKKAWRVYNLIKKMRRGIVRFFFQKVDGSTREAWGTLAPDLIPAIAGTDDRKKNDFVQVYFDTEKREWRSFKAFNLITIA